MLLFVAKMLSISELSSCTLGEQVQYFIPASVFITKINKVQIVLISHESGYFHL